MYSLFDYLYWYGVKLYNYNTNAFCIFWNLMHIMIFKPGWWQLSCLCNFLKILFSTMSVYVSAPKAINNYSHKM